MARLLAVAALLAAAALFPASVHAADGEDGTDVTTGVDDITLLDEPGNIVTMVPDDAAEPEQTEELEDPDVTIQTLGGRGVVIKPNFRGGVTGHVVDDRVYKGHTGTRHTGHGSKGHQGHKDHKGDDAVTYPCGGWCGVTVHTHADGHKTYQFLGKAVWPIHSLWRKDQEGAWHEVAQGEEARKQHAASQARKHGKSA